MNNAYSVPLSDFLAYLRECASDYSMAQSIEQETNSQTHDLLHCLELEPHPYHEQARLAKALAKTRQVRRDAKNVCEQTKAVVEWLEQNGPVVKSLERLLGDVRKAEKRVENQSYNRKTDIVEQTIGGA